MNNNYKTYGHAKTRLRYHIIFSTKYRRKCLTDIRQYVLDSFRYAESISDLTVVTMELDKDHIHLLLEFKPQLSISSVVNRLKSVTTNYLYTRCLQHLRQYYWNENILWTKGYFCSTIG